MPARYAALPNPRSAPDAEREMEDAFDLDGDDDGDTAHESTPLTYAISSPTRPEHPSRIDSSAIPGGYDFEREYDFPPPGSPPRPSSRALPNDFGNSNGQLPVDPIQVPKPRTSFLRRAVGAIIPMYYERVPTEAHSTRGGGIENDGVFANVTAKPQAARTIRTEDGDIHLVPEDNQKESPPTYLEAQADAVPPYWETTVHAPAGLEPGADMIIDDLPTGSFLIFCLNVFISFFFQFVGFLLTYLLHTSHAAKFGSRAGLGLTLIQYGFYSRTMSLSDDNSNSEGGSGTGVEGGWASPATTTTGDVPATPVQNDMISPTSRDWLSFLFMTLGWFLLLSSIIGFWRVKRWEQSVRTPAAPPTAEEVERDGTVRRGLADVFLFGGRDERNSQPRIVRDEEGNTMVIPAPDTLAEARLNRDLRAAGLL